MMQSAHTHMKAKSSRKSPIPIARSPHPTRRSHAIDPKATTTPAHICHNAHTPPHHRVIIAMTITANGKMSNPLSSATPPPIIVLGPCQPFSGNLSQNCRPSQTPPVLIRMTTFMHVPNNNKKTKPSKTGSWKYHCYTLHNVLVYSERRGRGMRKEENLALH